jgi:signal transduction histidine kinase
MNDPSAADVACQIAQQAQLALEEVRSVSRGLFPVEIGADGLLAELRHLAATMTAVHDVPVQVTGEVPVAFREGRVATQLFRIAQEAVTNAVKHGRPHAIRIALWADGDETTLRIADDGLGIAAQPQTGNGLGLRIMRYRARSIGGCLAIAPGHGGGTVVTCSFRDTPEAAVVAGWRERHLVHAGESAP